MTAPTDDAIRNYAADLIRTMAAETDYLDLAEHMANQDTIGGVHIADLDGPEIDDLQRRILDAVHAWGNDAELEQLRADNAALLDGNQRLQTMNNGLRQMAIEAREAADAWHRATIDLYSGRDEPHPADTKQPREERVVAEDPAPFRRWLTRNLGGAYAAGWEAHADLVTGTLATLGSDKREQCGRAWVAERLADLTEDGAAAEQQPEDGGDDGR